MKQTYKPKDDGNSFLQRKWGSNEAEKLERTHQYILEVISHRWEGMTEEQRRYFRGKQEWEYRWKKIKEEETQAYYKK